MKSITKSCYQTCISKKFLPSKKLVDGAIQMLTQNNDGEKQIGRPAICPLRALSGIYYTLKTGCQWNAIPRCFGSSSAIHRFFQYLVSIDFFKGIWKQYLIEYDQKIGIDFSVQAMDAAITKAPLGGESTGINPVDRKKIGTKRSVLVDRNGIPLGCCIGSANQHDSQLVNDTLASVPEDFPRPILQRMELDAAYDSQEVRVALFNYSYVPQIAHNKRRARVSTKLNRYLSTTKERWKIERSHSWQNRFRRIYVRWEKKLKNYASMLHFSFAIVVMKKLPI